MQATRSGSRMAAMPDVSVVLPAAESPTIPRMTGFWAAWLMSIVRACDAARRAGSSPALVPELDRLGAAADLQLVEQVAQVKLHRVHRNAETAGELSVGPAATQLAEQFALARAERLQRVVVNPVHIQKGKHHLAEGHGLDRVDQPLGRLAFRHERGRPQRHRMAGQGRVRIAGVDYDPRAVRPLPQGLEHGPAVVVGHDPADDSDVETQSPDRLEKALAVAGGNGEAEPLRLREQALECREHQGALVGDPDLYRWPRHGRHRRLCLPAGPGCTAGPAIPEAD